MIHVGMFCSSVWRSGDLGWRKGPQYGRQLKSKAPVRMPSGESEDGVDTSKQREWDALFRKTYLGIYLIF